MVVPLFLPLTICQKSVNGISILPRSISRVKNIANVSITGINSQFRGFEIIRSFGYVGFVPKINQKYPEVMFFEAFFVGLHIQSRIECSKTVAVKPPDTWYSCGVSFILY